MKKMALTAVAISATGEVFSQKENPSSPAQFKGDCVTTDDILGPFYRPGAPLRSDISFAGLKGVPIMISGTVMGPDCTTPLHRAKVEVWHCDTEGEYDNHSDAFLHRAHQVTDAEGNYTFQTILPGKYLNGDAYRPAHIHFRVRAKGHQGLVSQIYFQGDPHIAQDVFATKPKAQHRILPLTPDDIHGNLAVKFDIYLDEA